MAYASADDLAIFFDARILQDLVSDTGDPDPVWKTNAKLTTILASASGRIESACTVAQHYLVADLAALTGNSLALLKELTCTIAVALLIARRGGKYSEEYKEKIAAAEEFLDRLRKGERVFGIEDNQEAGMIAIEGPTIVTYTKLNLIPDRTKHYYPTREQRMPTSAIG